MTIYLPVDPAYALDYLAILEVKLQRGLPVREELEKVKSFLSRQFDLIEVQMSEEYVQLLHANAATFDAVEKANDDKVPASYVVARNYDRYLAKKDLQRRFWPQAELGEKKTSIEKTAVRR